MFLQGDLQKVFDALYTIGAIDPVLKLDWEKVSHEMLNNPQQCYKAFNEVNSCRGDKDLLVQKLARMETNSINYIALEVAREFCEFQDRKALH